ncbi:MAG: DUF6249 domain-containing protein [Pseudomonadota bacterium]|nr:DUF6249 domain-containing protein [Pseudomonadota bacterium]
MSFDLDSLPALLVPLMALFVPVALVFVVLLFKNRRNAETLATVRYLADKGMAVPAELLQPRAPHRNHRADALSWALTTIGAGLGLMVFFYSSGMQSLWGIGALVTIVGVAQLIAFRLSRQLDVQQPGTEVDGA